VYARTPGISKSLPVSRNELTGEKELSGYGVEGGHTVKSSLRVFAPVAFGMIDRDSIPKKMSDILIDNDIAPGRMSRSFEILGQLVRLTAEEFEAYKLASTQPKKGKSFPQAVVDMAATPLWKRLTSGPDGGRAIMIEKLLSVHRTVGKITVMNDPRFDINERAAAAFRKNILGVQ